MNKRYMFLAFALIIGAIIISGCTNTGNWTDNHTINMSDYNPVNATNTTTNTFTNTTKNQTQTINESLASYKIEAVEGDLVKIPIKAVDPDGDYLTYTFEKPFNSKGIWQTAIGNEGKYLTKVTVSDGKLSTSEYVLVTIARANRPPTIECPDTIKVQETETVNLDCNIFDVDGDVVIVGYDGWMRAASYTTKYGDAGTHTVIVRARDKTHKVYKEINVIVTKKNRAPVIKSISNQEVQETQLFKVDAKVTDPDGDKVTVTYSEPLNSKGEWTPIYGDRGTYNITLTATDGQTTTTQEFQLKVDRVNRAPVIKPINNISVEEGETVKIPIQAYDPDGDNVILAYSGWMSSDTYTTTYNDAYPTGCTEKGCTATYHVNVTASDGTLSSSQDVTIYVKDKNRPPEFVIG